MSGYLESTIWKCSVCGKDLSTKYSLARHVRRHFEETPQYSCELCGLQFSWKESLNFHTRKKHPNHMQIDANCDQETN
ncbi:UNVERIFIED_CONTAM: PR domain zinc finger protein 15 [Trichonephila clavipes]